MSAYSDGFNFWWDAAEADPVQNPHTPGTSEHAEWTAGFVEAERHFKKELADLAVFIKIS